MTLRVTDGDDGSQAADDEATWLLGHTERISFGELQVRDDAWWVAAVLHIPCRFLVERTGACHCVAHGFHGALPPVPHRETQPRRLGGDGFRVVEGARLVDRQLSGPPPTLPILGENPCRTAQCRTADHRRGAACCRDLQLDIRCPSGDSALESLVRARKPPYLCKIERASEEILNVEVISACGYLDETGRNCMLHGRLRSDGAPAKPAVCSAWPEGGDFLHSGCALTAKPLTAS